jgi:hypothetical protein
MTDEYDSAIPRRNSPEFCMYSCPENRGRRECRVPKCTRSIACKCKNKAHDRRHHRFTGSPGIPRTMVLTAYFVFSPVTSLVDTVAGRKHPAGLTPALGRQDQTTRLVVQHFFRLLKSDRSHLKSSTYARWVEKEKDRLKEAGPNRP